MSLSHRDPRILLAIAPRDPWFVFDVMNDQHRTPVASFIQGNNSGERHSVCASVAHAPDGDLRQASGPRMNFEGLTQASYRGGGLLPFYTG